MKNLTTSPVATYIVLMVYVVKVVNIILLLLRICGVRMRITQLPATPTLSKNMATPLGSAQFGVTTFCASQHGAEECDSRGLPLTLNSVNITGRFKKLLSLSHPSLATYLDIKSSRNGKILRHRRSIMVPSREF